MIYQRALLREISYTATAVFLSLFAILVTVVLIRLLGQAAVGGIPAGSVVALIGFGSLIRLPAILTLTLFLGVLLPLSRSYRDSEMVVWSTAGLALNAWVRPVLYFAVPVAVLIAVMTLFLSPWGERVSAEYQQRMETRDDTERVSPGVFRESSGGKRVFFVEVGAGLEGRVSNVFVSDSSGSQLSVITSAEGFLRTDEEGQRYVVLEKGRRYDGEPGSAKYRVTEFERYEVHLESRQADAQPARTRSKTTEELIAQPTERHLSELAGRISSPLAAFMLALLAIPLAFVNPRAGRTNNILIAIFMYLIYSNVINILQAKVTQGSIGFWPAVVLPHAVALALVVFLFYYRTAVTPFWRAKK